MDDKQKIRSGLLKFQAEDRAPLQLPEHPGHALVVLEAERHTVALRLPVRRIKIEKRVWSVVARDAPVPVEASGKDATLPSHSPLRTKRATFAAFRSSLSKPISREPVSPSSVREHARSDDIPDAA